TSRRVTSRATSSAQLERAARDATRDPGSGARRAPDPARAPLAADSEDVSRARALLPQRQVEERLPSDRVQRAARPPAPRRRRYVLNNGRKHGAWSAKDRPDPYSSGRWFLRWCTLDPLRRPLRIPAVERPHTFELLALPAIALDDLPGPRHYDDGESIESPVTALA